MRMFKIVNGEKIELQGDDAACARALWADIEEQKAERQAHERTLENRREQDQLRRDRIRKANNDRQFTLFK